MTFAYRLKLYGFGFIIGIFILGVILKGKQCSSPNQMKIKELKAQSMVFSEKAKCSLKCMGISEGVFKTELTKCCVNYDKTSVNAKPCGKYFIEGLKPGLVNFTALIEDCDTLSSVTEITLTNKKNCACE